MPLNLSAIDHREIGDELLHIEGHLEESIFALGKEDARPLSAVAYSLDLIPGGDVLIVTGSLELSFELECARCSTRFPQDIRLDTWQTDFSDKEGTINLTERIREDILFALPAYPRCDEGSDHRVCPVGNRFTDEGGEPLDSGEEAAPDSDTSGTWDALDNWAPPPSSH